MDCGILSGFWFEASGKYMSAISYPFWRLPSNCGWINVWNGVVSYIYCHTTTFDTTTSLLQGSIKLCIHRKCCYFGSMKKKKINNLCARAVQEKKKGNLLNNPFSACIQIQVRQPVQISMVTYHSAYKKQDTMLVWRAHDINSHRWKSSSISITNLDNKVIHAETFFNKWAYTLCCS